MNAALRHRGPDAEGLWSSGRAVLGHRRLSIIDLSVEGNQPLLNEDETIGVVVNGEIYNFVELRADLLARGHIFRSNSDSEVVVHLYEEFGIDFVEKLKGMFAFALWDGARDRLILGRDRAGKKPLFFRYLPDGGFAFASELHALVRAFPGLPVAPNFEGIGEYLTLQYVPSPHTAYSDIFKLEAAHAAVLERGKRLVSRRYWSIPHGPELRGTEEDMAAELRFLLTRAVSRRMVADVPVGAFLSGGIDSSAVVAMMAGHSSRPIQTFSIGFPHAADSELPWAQMVAERYGTVHHEATIGPDVGHILVESIRHHGEPFGDSSAVATYCLSKVTREYVTVALSGDGSDETFAGYTRYKTAQLAHVYDTLPARMQPLYQGALRAVARVAAPHVMGFIDHLGDGEAARYPYIMCQFTPEEKSRLFGPAMRAVSGETTQERFGKLLAASTRPSRLGRLIELDWQTYLVDDINSKVDVASMAHSLEVRCPMLDTDVVEFAARIPRTKLMRIHGKHLLRRAVSDLLPPAILRRPKRGFGLPLRRWMTHDLAPLVRDVLLDRTARERGLFEPTEVSRLVGSMHRDRTGPDRVWTLLVLELWFREFVDKQAPALSPLSTAP